jgi:hypothetical protein
MKKRAADQSGPDGTNRPRISHDGDEASTASGPEDLFAAIAKHLDPDQREYFYRRMVYFRHLRPDDELLRIVEAIAFLALIIREAPQAVAIERNRIAGALTTSLASLRTVTDTAQIFQRQLEERLTALPAAIAEGIAPSAIAQAITESLRQQFVESGLPIAAQALNVIAQELSERATDFHQTATQLSRCTALVNDAHRAVEDIHHAVSNASFGARKSIEDAMQILRIEYKWVLSVLCAVSFVLGTMFGIALHRRWTADSVTSDRPVMVAPLPPAEPPSPTEVTHEKPHRASPSRRQP